MMGVPSGNLQMPDMRIHRVPSGNLQMPAIEDIPMPNL